MYLHFHILIKPTWLWDNYNFASIFNLRSDLSSISIKYQVNRKRVKKVVRCNKLRSIFNWNFKNILIILLFHYLWSQWCSFFINGIHKCDQENQAKYSKNSNFCCNYTSKYVSIQHFVIGHVENKWKLNTNS